MVWKSRLSLTCWVAGSSTVTRVEGGGGASRLRKPGNTGCEEPYRSCDSWKTGRSASCTQLGAAAPHTHPPSCLRVRLACQGQAHRDSHSISRLCKVLKPAAVWRLGNRDDWIAAARKGHCLVDVPQAGRWAAGTRSKPMLTC